MSNSSQIRRYPSTVLWGKAWFLKHSPKQEGKKCMEEAPKRLDLREDLCAWGRHSPFSLGRYKWESKNTAPHLLLLSWIGISFSCTFFKTLKRQEIYSSNIQKYTVFLFFSSHTLIQEILCEKYVTKKLKSIWWTRLNVTPTHSSEKSRGPSSVTIVNICQQDTADWID